MKNLVLLVMLFVIAVAQTSPQQVTSFLTARLGPIPFPGQGRNEETSVVNIRCERTSSVIGEEGTACRSYCQAQGVGFASVECLDGFCHCREHSK